MQQWLIDIYDMTTKTCFSYGCHTCWGECPCRF